MDGPKRDGHPKARGCRTRTRAEQRGAMLLQICNTLGPSRSRSRSQWYGRYWPRGTRRTEYAEGRPDSRHISTSTNFLSVHTVPTLTYEAPGGCTGQGEGL